MKNSLKALVILTAVILIAIGLVVRFAPVRGVNLPVEVSPNQSDLYTEFNLSVYPPTLVWQLRSLGWEGQYRETFITTKGIVYRWKNNSNVVEQVLLKPNICSKIEGMEVLLTITPSQYIVTPCH